MTNNQFQSLDSINCVEDISPEDAAAYSGGAINLYNGANQTGTASTFTGSIANLADFGIDNTTSSISITDNQTWILYKNANFSGASQSFSATNNSTLLNNIVGGFNNSFSSIQLVP
ncbi:hypothetical protein LC605_15870 [Nostoc sp. CHAB 5836]|uniref:beta/gamma crystallin-related protein n=1 Tax=Nostoc sp. CHAB 5836 TaxID=2780404 RepID=UPI001E3834EC|nr:beta/gamma crystallin-related protein [Nostoc sp. CHAB 5836]MCC5616522.1 hypothetical protein [Nostoc sp. CHAB 5836]